VIWAYVEAEGLDRPAQALEKTGAKSDYVLFLRNFDVDFRIRRLRFMVRRVNALASTPIDAAARRGLEAMKSGLYRVVAPYLVRRQTSFYTGVPRAPFATTMTEPAAALAALAEAMDLKDLDTASDAAMVELFAQLPTQALRHDLLTAYLGFPFFDIAMLPLLQGDGIDEFEEIKVDRLSPDDALSLRHIGGGELRGAQLNAFGAFFSRAYREHDYLWGRLHGAERLIDIVASALPDDAMLPPARLAELKRAAFTAIVNAERSRLVKVPDLLAALDAALAAPLSPSA
jgi:hypothetical protein